MGIGRVALNTRTHFAQILDVWAGRESTHRKIIETIDDQGNIIDRSTTETNIVALIGNPPFSEKGEPIGAVQSGTLCLYFWYNNNDDDIIVSEQLTPTTERHDQIVFQDVTYKVANLDEIAYDLNTAGDDHEPIFAKYSLKKIAPN